MYGMVTKEEWTCIAITKANRDRLRKLAADEHRSIAGQLSYMLETAASTK